MAADYSIYAEITADTKGFTKGIKDANKQTETFSQKLKGALNGSKGFGVQLGAIGVAVGVASKSIKKFAATMNECAEAYKVQAIAERQLEQASKNNPYLNSDSIRRLKEYASQMQKISNYGDEAIIQLMGQLASAGRKEEEIQKIIKTAMDISATGIMDLDSAVKALNGTYTGTVGLLGKQVGELKTLTKEELESGKAVDILAEKYKGMAEKSIDSQKQLNNAVGDFKEELGARWESIFSPLKKEIANIVSGWADALKKVREYKNAVKQNKTDATYESVKTQLEYEKEKLNKLKSSYDAYLEYVNAPKNQSRGKFEIFKSELSKSGVGDFQGLVPSVFLERYKELEKTIDQLLLKEQELRPPVQVVTQEVENQTEEIQKQVEQTEEITDNQSHDVLSLQQANKEMQKFNKWHKEVTTASELLEENTEETTFDVSKLKDGFKAVASTVGDIAKKIGSGIISGAKWLFNLDIDEFKENLYSFQDKLLSFFVEILPQLPQLLAQVLSGSGNMLEQLGNVFAEGSVNGFVTSFPKMLSDSFPKIVKGLGSGLKTFIKGFIKAIKEIMKGDGLQQTINLVLDLILEVADLLLENLPVLIEVVFKILVELTKAIIKRLPEIITLIVKALPEILWELIKGIGELIVEGIKSFFGGKGSLATLFGYANGTKNATSGLHLVGENGPELVSFRGGEKVYTAKETSQMLGGGNNFNVTFNNLNDTTAYSMMNELRQYQRNLAIQGAI